MSRELKNIVALRKNLEAQLKEFKKNSESLIKRIKNGEFVSQEELNKNVDTAKIIKDLEAKISLCKEYETIEGLKEKFGHLLDTDLNDTAKEKLTKSIKKDIKSFNKYLENEILLTTSLTKDEVINKPADTRNNLFNELDSLDNELSVAEKRGFDTLDITLEYNEKKNNLDLLNRFLNEYVSDARLTVDFFALDTKQPMEEKLLIIDRYNKIFNNYLSRNNSKYAALLNKDSNSIVIYSPERAKSDTIVRDINSEPVLEVVNENQNEDEFVSDSSLEDEVSRTINDNNSENIVSDDEIDELTYESSDNSKTLKTVGKIIGTVVLCGAIIWAAKSCSKDINKNNNVEPTTDISNEEINERAENIVVTSLKNIGYDEYSAGLMYQNFSEDTIKAILASPYIEGLEFYATEPDFKLVSFQDYENARIKFGITAQEIVDYVNRAKKISETNFLEGASVLDLTEVVMGVDRKEVGVNGNYLDNIFNVGFNNIMVDYFTDNITNNTIKRIEALRYIAKNNTDMDRFLERLHDLTKAVFEDPTNNIKKDELFRFFRVFAYSLNGFTNPEYLTTDKEFNENAILNDYFDYYIAYQSFIKPVIPVMNHKEAELIDGAVIENLYAYAANIEDKEERLSAIDKYIEAYASDYFKQADIKEKTIEEFEKYRSHILAYLDIMETQNYAETAILGPEFTEICGRARVRVDEVEGGK